MPPIEAMSVNASSLIPVSMGESPLWGINYDNLKRKAIQKGGTDVGKDVS
jgi:hypothetical protein